MSSYIDELGLENIEVRARNNRWLAYGVGAVSTGLGLLAIFNAVSDKADLANVAAPLATFALVFAAIAVWSYKTSKTILSEGSSLTEAAGNKPHPPQAW